MIKKNLKNFLVVLTFAAFTSACAPEVGSEEWCADMKAKDKGTWTADDAGAFAKHCLM